MDILQILSAAATLLLAVQQQPNPSPEAVMQALRSASQAIQFSEYALAKKQGPLQETPNNSVYPRINHLRNALYLDAQGNRVPVTKGVALIEEYTSFGNINGDDTDDAVAVVRKDDGIYYLAAMLNVDKTLFDIAEVPLGHTLSVYSHRVIGDSFAIEMQTESLPRGTYTYTLFGNKFIKK